MKENKRKLGAFYEKEAAAYLRKQGYEILEYNYRCPLGEIDLIARDGKYRVFVEVKYRKDAAKGSALEAVNSRKQAVICKTAQHYRMTHHCPEDLPCRFDVVGITGEEICLIKDAFSYQ